MCQKDHRAKDHHNREEVKKKINRLKERHTTSLLTCEEKEYIADMFSEVEAERPDKYDKEADWVDEREDDESEGDLGYIMEQYLAEVEAISSDSVLVHGRYKQKLT